MTLNNKMINSNATLTFSVLEMTVHDLLMFPSMFCTEFQHLHFIRSHLKKIIDNKCRQNALFEASATFI